MKLSNIKNAGEGAQRLITAVNVMNSSANIYGLEYDALIDGIRTVFGDPALTLRTLTDAQVNSYFLGSMGDVSAIATAKIVCSSWEIVITTLKAEIAKLPMNDI